MQTKSIKVKYQLQLSQQWLGEKKNQMFVTVRWFEKEEINSTYACNHQLCLTDSRLTVGWRVRFLFYLHTQTHIFVEAGCSSLCQNNIIVAVNTNLKATYTDDHALYR